MSGSEGPGQAQRYCTSCGAQVRPGNAFCTSCGGRLTSGPEPAGPSSPPRGHTDPLADALGMKLRGAARWLGSLQVSRRGNSRGVPARTAQWFKELAFTTKAVLAGLALLLVLVILVLHRSLAGILAALVFSACLLALIDRAVRHRPVKGWGVATAASLVLVLALAGLSSISFGSDVPAYEIIDSQQIPDPSGYSHVIVYVFSDSVSQTSLEGIAEDIAPGLQDNDSVIVMVWDEDQASYDPVRPFVMRVSAANGGFLPPAARITFAFSSAGASSMKVPEGDYSIMRGWP